MTTRYPGAIDGYAEIRIVADRFDEIVAADHNSLRSAVIAIEQTLGLNPQGIFGTVVERLEDAYGSLQAHVGGLPPRHRDSVIESPLRTGSPYFSLTAGTVGSQLEELLSHVNGMRYGGSLPSKFDDGYFLPASRMDSAITQLVTRLGGSLGARGVGFSGTTDTFADGYALAASSVAQAINQILAQLGGTSGLEKVGTADILSEPRNEFTLNGPAAADALSAAADVLEEQNRILNAALGGLVVSGMQVTRVNATQAAISAGDIVSRGRHAAYAGGTFTHSGVGAHILYATINSSGAVVISDTTNSTTAAGVNGSYPTVPLASFTESGAGWTADSDLRRFGKWANNKPYLTVGSDGYGADFTSLHSAIAYVQLLSAAAGGITPPRKIVLNSNLSLAASSTPVALPSQIEIDGGGHYVEWQDNGPLFQGTDAYGVILKDIRARFAGAGGLTSSSFYKGLASSVAISDIAIRNCWMDGGAYKFAEFDDGGSFSISDVEIANCDAQVVSSAVYAPPSSNPIMYARVSDNRFVQAAIAAVGTPCVTVGSHAVITDNFIYGGFSIGIEAGTGETSVIHGNVVNGGSGSAAGSGSAFMPVGIQVSAPSASFATRSIVSDNVVKGTTTWGIAAAVGSDSAAHVIISGNVIDNRFDTATGQTGIVCEGDESLAIGNYVLYSNAGIVNASHAIGNIILGSQGTPGGAIVISNSVNGAIVAKNYVKNYAGLAIEMGSGSLHVISGNYLQASGGYGVATAVQGTGTQCQILDNYISIYGVNTASKTVDMPGDWNMFAGNYFKNCRGIMFDLGGDWVTVRGNYAVASVQAESLITAMGAYNTVCDNYVYGYGTSVTAVLIGSAGSASLDAVIANNMFAAASGIALSLGDAAGMIVQGNFFDGTVLASTAITGFAENSIVSGNGIVGYGANNAPCIETSSSAYGCSVSGNSLMGLRSTATAAIYVDSGSVFTAVAGNIMGDSVLTGTPKVGIDANSVPNLSIVGNVIVGTDSGVSDDAAIKNLGQRNLVVGNKIYYANYNAIVGTGAHYCLIADNMIHDSNRSAIILDASTDCLVIGNYADTCLYGVAMLTSSARSRIIGNSVNTCAIGVLLGSTADNSHILGNYVNGHDGSTAYNMSGSDNLTIIGNASINPSSSTGMNLSGCANTLLVGNRCYGVSGTHSAFVIDNTPANTLTAAGNLAHHGPVPNANDGAAGTWSTGNSVDTANCRHVGTP